MSEHVQFKSLGGWIAPTDGIMSRYGAGQESLLTGQVFDGEPGAVEHCAKQLHAKLLRQSGGFSVLSHGYCHWRWADVRKQDRFCRAAMLRSSVFACLCLM